MLQHPTRDERYGYSSDGVSERHGYSIRHHAATPRHTGSAGRAAPGHLTAAATTRERGRLTRVMPSQTATCQAESDCHVSGRGMPRPRTSEETARPSHASRPAASLGPARALRRGANRSMQTGAGAGTARRRLRGRRGMLPASTGCETVDAVSRRIHARRPIRLGQGTSSIRVSSIRVLPLTLTIKGRRATRRRPSGIRVLTRRRHTEAQRSRRLWPSESSLSHAPWATRRSRPLMSHARQSERNFLPRSGRETRHGR